MRYVVGFAFDERARVVLVRKRRPAWQAGRLNGVGGKVEGGEEPLAAMRREFVEETGVALEAWEQLSVARFDEQIEVHVFWYAAPSAALDAVRSVTDEPIEVHPADAVVAEPAMLDDAALLVAHAQVLAADRHAALGR